MDISTVSKILLYFFRATVNEVRLDNVYIDTCNSSGRVMDWSVMLETHHILHKKNRKCTSWNHNFLVWTRQNFILQGSLVYQ